MKLLIGADPEVFVREKTTGLFKSAHTLIPGTKEKPFPVPFGAVQRDGVAAEFNINPAASSDEFVHNIKSVYHTLTEMIGTDYDLVAIPTAHFLPEYFRTLPRKAKELGCQPDYSAYTEQANIPPKTKETFRTGAGHIHLGWDSNRDRNDPVIMRENFDLVKQLDSVLFFASLLWDKDSKRRELYGNIGAFRPKTYGLEYRPMSNAWLNDDDLIRWVYDMAKWATELFFKGELIYRESHVQEMKHWFDHNELNDQDEIIEYNQWLHQEGFTHQLPEKYFAN